MAHSVLKLSWNEKTIAVNVDRVVAVEMGNVYKNIDEILTDKAAVTIYTDSIALHFRTSREQANKIEQFIMSATEPMLEVEPDFGFSVSSAAHQ